MCDKNAVSWDFESAHVSPMFFACSLVRRRPRQKRGKCLEPTSRAAAAGPHVQEEANRVAITCGQTAVPFIAINVIKSCSARPHEEGRGLEVRLLH